MSTSVKLERTNVWMTTAQKQRLHSLKLQTGLSSSEHLRRALDHYFISYTFASEEENK